jgi:hypothetical protein
MKRVKTKTGGSLVPKAILFGSHQALAWKSRSPNALTIRALEGRLLLFILCRLTVRLGNLLISNLSHSLAIPKKVIHLPVTRSHTTSTPTLFQIRSYGIPFVMQFATELSSNGIHILGQTQPGFLTFCEMRRHDVFKGSYPAIFTFGLIRSTWKWTVCHLLLAFRFVFGIISHLIVDASVEFDRLTDMEIIVIIWNNALKCHATMKVTDLTAPSFSIIPFSITPVSLSYNVDKRLIDGHVGTQDQEPTLDRFIREARTHHVI